MKYNKPIYAVFGAAFLMFSALTFVFADAGGLSPEEFKNLIPDLTASNAWTMRTAQQRLQDACLAAGAPGKEEERRELNELMAGQLDQPIDPVAKTWILYQLGRTGTDAEVPAIAALLNDEDFRVRQQALRSLGLIKTDAAVEALKKAAESSDEPVKTEIEQTLNVLFYDFTIPVETEWPLCLPYVDDGEVQGWLANYDSFDVTTKARTIASLTVRGDRKYRSYILDAAHSSDPDLKRDGILGLEKLGTVDDIPLLLETARDPELERVAIIVADRIESPGFDEAILDDLKKADNQADFFNLVKIAVARRIDDALPYILDGAAKMTEIRSNLLQWSEPLMEESDLPRFIELMLSISDAKQREQLEQAAFRIADGNAEPILAAVNDQSRVTLLPILGRFGGEKVVALLSESLQSASKAEQEAAVKGFCNTPNAVPADTLMAIAKDPKRSGANRIAALRAYVRVISLPNDQIGITITDQEKLEALKAAFKIAGRDDEKDLILGRMKAVRLPETVDFVLPFTDDPKFADTAYDTVVELAHHDFLRKKAPETFAAALKKVIENDPNTSRVDEAKRYAEAMKSAK